MGRAGVEVGQGMAGKGGIGGRSEQQKRNKSATKAQQKKALGAGSQVQQKYTKSTPRVHRIGEAATVQADAAGRYHGVSLRASFMGCPGVTDDSKGRIVDGVLLSLADAPHCEG